MATTAKTKPASDVAYLCRALKAPSMAAAVERLAERARSDGWTHEEFLAACLEREVAARAANGGELRIRAARFPARKSLDEFDFDHQRSLRRDVDRPPRHPGLRRRPRQRRVPRPARHRQDPPRHRPVDPGLPSRPPRRVRHRRRMGRPPRRSPTAADGSTTSSAGSAATRSSSSTKSATSPSNPKPPTCSSSSSPPATNAPP